MSIIDFFSKKFPVFNQHDTMDCGPTCIRMIARYHGKDFSLDALMALGHVNRDGISLQGIADMAEGIGFRSLAVKVDYEQLLNEVPLPAVAFWRQNHFIVIYAAKNNKITIADPRSGLINYNRREFLKGWYADRYSPREEGMLILMEPTHNFYEMPESKGSIKSGFAFLMNYVKKYRFYTFQLIVGLIVGSGFQLLFPFLTQAIVDYGIKNRDLSFIHLVLLAQLVLFVTFTSLNFLRSWIIIHISTRVNISIISDFLIKLMKLPVSFFDSKWTGDIMQRIRDHKKIENFLSDAILNSLFSICTIFIFGITLAVYNLNIFLVFLISSFLEIAWLFLFFGKRKNINNKMFAQMAADQNNILQLISGMQEIKLNNIETLKRWEWERIQSSLFKIQIKDLSLGQWLTGGTTFLNYLQTLIITFIAALSVIDGSMSIGAMVAVIFIVGQLSNPMAQIVSFLQAAQDAKISIERLVEIHEKNDETSENNSNVSKLPILKNITVNRLSFNYAGTEGKNVLDNILITVPAGKITAIVGSSGSGKTTLLKLLLKFYKPTLGEITVGDVSLDDFDPAFWRSQCGVVMQDGFIFSDTIAKNIAMQENIDAKTLKHSASVANIATFIEDLPMGYNSIVGPDGIGLSQGQKQRLLIARAVYKDPEFIFFDEATNALDSNNESIIMKNLNEFFRGRTVIVVAHRLSTVRNADQIIVLNNGKIEEIGTHNELSKQKKYYYQLVKNQLELGV